jgi:CheY-like chemotaxis protein/PAS domain-containing protein
MTVHEVNAEHMSPDHSHSVVAAVCRIVEDLDELDMDLSFGLLLCDPDRGLRLAPQNFLNLVGLSLEHASGFGWMERLSASSLRSIERWRNKGNANDWEQEIQLRNRHGSLRTLLFHALPIAEDGGTVHAWIVVYLDITDRKNATQIDHFARDFSEAVVRTLPVPIVVVHSSHRIIAANASFYRLFQSSRTVMEGHSIDDLLTSRESELSARIDAVCQRGESFDDLEVYLAAPSADERSHIVSGRRMIVPNQTECMVLLTLTASTRAVAGGQSLIETLDDIPEPGRTPANYRVLVVDDSESDSFLVSQLLQVMGHTVVVTHNGADALRKASDFAPDIIIADIAMPEMDGNEFAKRFRTGSGSRHVLLVALSGYEPPAASDGHANSIFDVYLTKPIEITELQSLFEMLPHSR